MVTWFFFRLFPFSLSLFFVSRFSTILCLIVLKTAYVRQWVINTGIFFVFKARRKSIKNLNKHTSHTATKEPINISTIVNEKDEFIALHFNAFQLIVFCERVNATHKQTKSSFKTINIVFICIIGVENICSLYCSGIIFLT